MSLEIVSEIWNFVKEGMSTHDRENLAEHMVGLMFDNDYTAEDIQAAFPGDKAVKEALVVYSGDLDTVDEEEWDDEFEEFEEDTDSDYDDDY